MHFAAFQKLSVHSLYPNCNLYLYSAALDAILKRSASDIRAEAALLDTLMIIFVVTVMLSSSVNLNVFEKLIKLSNLFMQRNVVEDSQMAGLTNEDLASPRTSCSWAGRVIRPACFISPCDSYLNIFTHSVQVELAARDAAPCRLVAMKLCH